MSSLCSQISSKSRSVRLLQSNHFFAPVCYCWGWTAVQEEHAPGDAPRKRKLRSAKRLSDIKQPIYQRMLTVLLLSPHKRRCCCCSCGVWLKCTISHKFLKRCRHGRLVHQSIVTRQNNSYRRHTIVKSRELAQRKVLVRSINFV